MTYIAFDGVHLVADKLARQKVGGYMIGRKPLDENGYLIHSDTSKTVPIYYNDVSKIIKLRDGYSKGIKLTHLAMAGTVNNLHELVLYLERGNDLDHYTDAECAVTGASNRRLFTPGNGIIAVQADGKATLAVGMTSGINYKVGDRFHLGAGVSWVDGIGPHVSPKLDAEEQFVIASHYSREVSLVFDRLTVATGVLDTKLQYDLKDRMTILRNIQRRFKLDGDPAEREYVNKE